MGIDAHSPRWVVVTLLLLSLLLSLPVGCGGGASTVGVETAPVATTPTAALAVADPPLGKLPVDVTPLRYRLELLIVPSRERFEGVVEIDLQVSAPTQRIYLHAQAQAVREVSLRADNGLATTAAFQTYGETGVASIDLGAPINPGRYTVRVVYDAAFDHQLKGLYRVDAGGQAYAFTQFEAIAARLAFPCFDEPRFKTPFEVTLTVPATERAISNTRELSAELLPENLRRVRFAPTEPLPTYLVAFAVGPLDVVEAEPIAANDVRARPIPFRAIAVAGKGKDLAHAIAHTPAMVAALERYFGIAYPYDKLDIIAVPDFAAGAMENAGAITFREPLLLLDAVRATEGQRRGFAYVMAHELAHQWFGNLVTMPWWDDIWLNEAFATWMGHRVVQELHPQYQADVSMLESVHHAMEQDSLTTARVIRQPIETSHDILNAFDSITYSKGGGVLEMFERYLGDDVFRAGIRAYMEQHRFATATSDDLIASLGAASQTELTSAFQSFLSQSGVPLLQTSLDCSTEVPSVKFEQSRYLPLGSTGDRARVWRVPVCVRWARGNDVQQTCGLVSERQAELRLVSEPQAALRSINGTCPDWLMPNADASGYFRFALSNVDLERLRTRGWKYLNVREQLAVADSLSAAFAAGAVDTNALLTTAPTLAAGAERSVVTAPMAWLEFARVHLVDVAMRSKVEAYGRALYSKLGARLGWQQGAAEDGETRLLRAEVLGFLALEANDPVTRREAKKRGRAYVGVGADGALHPEAVATDLVGVALTVAVQEGDVALFDHVVTLLGATDDAVLRERLLFALSATRDPVLAERALSFALDPNVRVNEALSPLSRRLHDPEQRDAAWTWFETHFDALLARVGPARGGRLPWMSAAYCSNEATEKVKALFTPHLETLNGGPRNLQGALEAIALCSSKVAAQRASANAFFASRRR